MTRQFNLIFREKKDNQSTKKKFKKKKHSAPPKKGAFSLSLSLLLSRTLLALGGAIDDDDDDGRRRNEGIDGAVRPHARPDAVFHPPVLFIGNRVSAKLGDWNIVVDFDSWWWERRTPKRLRLGKRVREFEFKV